MQTLVFESVDYQPGFATYKSNSGDVYTFTLVGKLPQPGTWKINGRDLDDGEVTRVEIARANYVVSHRAIHFLSFANDGDSTLFWDGEVLYSNSQTGEWFLAFISKDESIGVISTPFPVVVKEVLDRGKANAINLWGRFNSK